MAGVSSAASAAPEVSIIVVTYNATEYVRRCLESVRSRTHVPYELLAIDNASREDTQEYLRTLEGIRLILNDRNTLWSAACNQGFRAASPASRYLLLLNPDTEALRDDWLEALICVLESDPRVGIAGTTHHFRPAGPVHGWIDGQCMLIRRETLADVGPFESERFPMGGAPQLFAIRAYRKGWLYRQVHPSDRLILHHGARSRAELSGPAPWPEGRPDYEKLMREEGIEPRQPTPWETLRRKLPGLRSHGFFYHPPLGPAPAAREAYRACTGSLQQGILSAQERVSGEDPRPPAGLDTGSLAMQNPER